MQEHWSQKKYFLIQKYKDNSKLDCISQLSRTHIAYKTVPAVVALEQKATIVPREPNCLDKEKIYFKTLNP
jgi:hypothetical protein